MYYAVNTWIYRALYHRACGMWKFQKSAKFFDTTTASSHTDHFGHLLRMGKQLRPSKHRTGYNFDRRSDSLCELSSSFPCLLFVAELRSGLPLSLPYSDIMLLVCVTWRELTLRSHREWRQVRARVRVTSPRVKDPPATLMIHPI